MKPTTVPPSVELGSSSNTQSSTAYMGPPPSKKMLVDHNNESSALTILCLPQRVNVLVDRKNELVCTLNVMWPTPRENVLFGPKGGLDAFREFGASESDIPLHTHHPLFPQVDLLSFKDLAERSQAHHHNDALEKDGTTE
jgi:hypothetical protein